HRPWHHRRRTQCVLPRRWPVREHPVAVLVLVYADHLLCHDLAGSSQAMDGSQSDGPAGAGVPGHLPVRTDAALGHDLAGRSACARPVHDRVVAVPTSLGRDGGRTLMGDIRVSGLGKAYKQYPGQWSRLAEWIVPVGNPRHIEHWVLRDIDFHLRAGEAVGIVGANGAGKSTLLKILAGTVRPSCGKIEIGGRVAAMLELGMGFHPDFTGRQNAVMGGQLLGLSLEDIARLMPQIEAFAEIGEYIDQPVRTYSSGMQMRLAFSVATAQRPDILIVDEALSVGDSYFQHKSFERIRA